MALAVLLLRPPLLANLLTGCGLNGGVSPCQKAGKQGSWLGSLGLSQHRADPVGLRARG